MLGYEKNNVENCCEKSGRGWEVFQRVRYGFFSLIYILSVARIMWTAPDLIYGFFFRTMLFSRRQGGGWGGGDVRDGVWRRRNGRRKREGRKFRNLGRFPQTTDFELFSTDGCQLSQPQFGKMSGPPRVEVKPNLNTGLQKMLGLQVQ